jgi:hypothetical protein
MYLPIILVGFLYGAIAGTPAGMAAPLVSFALSGMPLAVVLPFVSIELIAIGFAAGMLRTAKLPAIAKLVLAQLAAKAIFAIAILAAIASGSETISTGNIFASIQMGLPGWALQWALIPLILFRLENRKRLEE